MKFQLKLEKEQIKASRRKGIIKMKVEISVIKNRKTRENKWNQEFVVFFRELIKLVNIWPYLWEKIEKTQITNIRNEEVDITTDCIYIKNIKSKYYE